MKILLVNIKSFITVIVLTAVIICAAESIVQAAVPSFQYNNFTITKNGKRAGSSSKGMYSVTEVTAYQTSNGFQAVAVAGASMYKNRGYTYVRHESKATVSSNKVLDSTTAWHSFDVGSTSETPANVWSQNTWTN